MQKSPFQGSWNMQSLGCHQIFLEERNPQVQQTRGSSGSAKRTDRGYKTVCSPLLKVLPEITQTQSCWKYGCFISKCTLQGMLLPTLSLHLLELTQNTDLVNIQLRKSNVPEYLSFPCCFPLRVKSSRSKESDSQQFECVCRIFFKAKKEQWAGWIKQNSLWAPYPLS